MSQTKAQLLDGKSATIQFTGGSASAPSVSFTGDTNTGIYSPGADQVAISTNGTGRLFVDSNGNVAAPVSIQIGNAAALGALGVRAATNGNLYVRDINSLTAGTGVALDVLNDSLTTVQDLAIRGTTTIFRNGTSETLRITSAGLVGVGTSSPTTNLSVAAATNATLRLSGNSTSYGELIFSSLGSGWDAYGASIEGTGQNTGIDIGCLIFKTSPGGVGNTRTERLRIDSSGRVGIGTTSPGFPLQIGATGSPGVAIDSANSGIHGTFGSGGGLVLRAQLAATAGGGQIFLGGSTRGDGDLNAIVFSNANSERARIDSSGRLLVGTSSGSAQVHIGSSQDSLFMDRNETTVGGSNAAFRKARGSTGSPSIVSDSDVIGTLSWRAYDGSTYVSNAFIRGEVDGTPGVNDMPGRLVFSTTSDGASSPTERMRIDSVGRVLVNSTSGAVGLISSWHVAGTRPAYSAHAVTTSSSGLIEFHNPNGLVGSISVIGSSTSYNTTSDYRLKENVIPVTDGITRLQQLKPSRFNFSADPEKTVDGFLAHEAAEVVPECVTGEKDAVDDDGNPIYQGIDQSKLVPLLTAALQEAVAKIESLEARLTAAGI